MPGLTTSSTQLLLNLIYRHVSRNNTAFGVFYADEGPISVAKITIWFDFNHIGVFV